MRVGWRGLAFSGQNKSSVRVKPHEQSRAVRRQEPEPGDEKALTGVTAADRQKMPNKATER